MPLRRPGHPFPIADRCNGRLVHRRPRAVHPAAEGRPYPRAFHRGAAGFDSGVSDQLPHFASQRRSGLEVEVLRELDQGFRLGRPAQVQIGLAGQ